VASLFIDGFDKYGPPGIDPGLTAGEWNSKSGTFRIAAGLSSTGNALAISGGVGSNVSKTLATTYSRLIGGFRFDVTTTLGGNALCCFLSGGAQTSIRVDGAGTISLVRGAASGTVIATSSASISQNSIHYLEWDLSFGPSSQPYQLWLDGVSIISGTGNVSASSTVLQFALGDVNVNSVGVTFDDLYLFDTTGGANNAVLLTSPRIETQFPTSDSSVAFSFGAAILGSSYIAGSTTSAPGANTLALRTWTPAVNCTLNSISIVPHVSSGIAKFKATLYADSTGAPGSLTATGTEVTGTTADATLLLPFSGGQSLTAGTPYWIGFITDTSILLDENDNSLPDFVKSNTYASGPPGPAGSMTGSQPAWAIYGNVTGTGVNWFEVDINPPPGDLSYVSSATVSQEDLYGFPALSVTPTAIYTMAVKGFIKRTDTGARTISLRCKSSSTDSGGSNTGQTPATSYGWMDSFFETDPATGMAWTASGVNAATSGVKIDS
jgi:hypothetical protein